MKMKTKKMKTTLSVVAVLAMMSCGPKENQDLEKPVIGGVWVNAVQQETHELSKGGAFVVQVALTDNNVLNQLKLNIHSADDGHGHVDLPGYEGLVNEGVWTYSRIFDLTGTTASPTATIAIPDTISGIWHLEVMAIDQSGNESDEKVYNLVVLP
jgi:hypothetical protein